MRMSARMNSRISVKPRRTRSKTLTRASRHANRGADREAVIALLAATKARGTRRSEAHRAHDHPVHHRGRQEPRQEQAHLRVPSHDVASLGSSRSQGVLYDPRNLEWRYARSLTLSDELGYRRKPGAIELQRVGRHVRRRLLGDSTALLPDRCGDRSRLDRCDLDAEPAQLESQRVGDRLERVLRRVVRSEERTSQTP